MIAEGFALIAKAVRQRRPGPDTSPVAISALHERAGKPEYTDWPEIDVLYSMLEQLSPSPVVTLNRAVATSKVYGADKALAMIEPLEERLSGYFYFWGVKGKFLMDTKRFPEAREAFNRAIALANTAAEAAHIRGQLDLLSADAGTLLPASGRKA